MSKLRRGKEQRKADREQKRQTPKVKMRSYGGGEKLPIVKSGKDFYLSGGDYDSKGHGKFIGEATGRLEGPSRRAIKGKGKKSANVRVGHGSNRASDGGDPIFLEDTSPVKMKNDYSSMKSMGQAVARWTSPLSAKGVASGAGNIVKKTSAVDYAMSQGWGSKDKTGKFTLSTEGAKKFTEWKKSNKDKKPKPTATKKNAPAKPKSKVEPLEKVEKRGEGINSMGEATYKTDVNLPQFSDPVTLSTSKITTKEEADKSRERRDNERMQKAVDTANASETLLKGKEKRKLAQYDRQAKRGSEESKLKRRTSATKGVQALGSLLVDIGKPDSKVKQAGVAAEKASTEKPEDDKKTTTEPRKFDITNLSF